MIRKWLISFSWKDLIIICLAIVAILFIRSKLKPSSDITTNPVIQNAIQERDKKGTSYTELQGTMYTEDQMKHVTDSLSRTLKNGKVLQVTNVVTLIDTVYQTSQVYVDTLSGTINASDSTLDSRISFQGNYRTHTGQFYLQLTPDTATYVTTWKHILLSKDKLTVNVYHTNKLFVPEAGDVYTSESPKIRAVIGPSIGVGWAGKWYPFIGVTLTYNVIGIKSK